MVTYGASWEVFWIGLTSILLHPHPWPESTARLPEAIVHKCAKYQGIVALDDDVFVTFDPGDDIPDITAIINDGLRLSICFIM